MAEAYGASHVKFRASEALSQGLRAEGDAAWASLILVMAEMERNRLAGVPQGAQSGSSSNARPLGFQWRGCSEILGLRNL